MSTDRPEAETDSFAALFEQAQKETKGPAVRRKKPRVGDQMEAVVVQVGRETVFVELVGKHQAFLEAAELRAPDGTMTVAVGDVIRARVVEVDEDGNNVRLGLSMGKPTDVTALEQAKEARMPVEGKVTKVNKGGLEVELAGTRAFCPNSQIDNKYVQDPASFVGKVLQFLVTEVRDGGKSVTLSRRAVLEHEARENATRVMKDVVVGATLRGTVTGVREFGAFVDIGGGVEGLVPASEIAHDRSVNVSSAVTVGDVVEVQVREVRQVEPKATRDRRDPTTKITLSLKALAKDPWEGVGDVLTEGKVARGTVTRVLDFGAFVRVAPGLEGLLHRSELGAKEEMPKPGETVDVVVKSIDRVAKKIALVQAPEGFAVGAQVKELRIAVGAMVTGTVERIETYGLFLQIDGTKGRAGRGLLPNAELGVARGTDLRKAFPEGTKLTAKVLETGDGRLRLSLKAAKDDAERADYEGYRETSAAPAKLGTLGDLLKKHGNKKR